MTDAELLGFFKRLGGTEKGLVIALARELRETTKNGFGYVLHADGVVISCNARGAKVLRKTVPGFLDFSTWDLSEKTKWFNLVGQVKEHVNEKCFLMPGGFWIYPICFSIVDLLIFKETPVMSVGESVKA